MSAVDLTQDVIAKSDQVNACDITEPVTVTVTGFTRVNDEKQPWHIKTDWHAQPWKPCKSMRRCLLRYWGKDADAWIGRQLTLFSDPNCKYAGKKIDGIRIAAMSGIEAAETFTAREWRGTDGLKTFVIQPISSGATEPTPTERLNKAVAAYDNAEDEPQLFKLDGLVDQLYNECDDEQKQVIQHARERAEKRLQS